MYLSLVAVTACGSDLSDYDLWSKNLQILLDKQKRLNQKESTLERTSTQCHSNLVARCATSHPTHKSLESLFGWGPSPSGVVPLALSARGLNFLAHVIANFTGGRPGNRLIGARRHEL